MRYLYVGEDGEHHEEHAEGAEEVERGDADGVGLWGWLVGTNVCVGTRKSVI